MIETMTIYNYALPGESLSINEDIYPVNTFSTEVDTRFNERNRPGEHGIWAGNTFFGKRLFHIEGDILADSSSAYIAARRRLLRMLMPKSHILPHQPYGYIEFLYSGMNELLTSEFTLDSYPEIPMEGLSPARTRYQLNLKSYDPRLYGTLRYVDALPTLTINGRVYNKTYNKTYAVTTPSGDVVVTNSGDIETPVTMIIHGPATSPYAIRVDSGGMLHSIVLQDLVLEATDTVVVDFKNRTAYTTSGVNVYSNIQGEWWVLEPGDNVIRIGAFSQVSGSYTTFQWNNGYMI